LRPLEAYPQKGRPFLGYAAVARALDSRIACMFLCCFDYWSDKGSNPDGWIYKTAAEIEYETTLSYKEQRTARSVLAQHGLIEENYNRLNHRMDFRVSREALDVFMKKMETVDSKEVPVFEVEVEQSQAVDSTPTAFGADGEMPLEQMGNIPQGSSGTSFGAGGICSEGSSYKEHRVLTESTNIEYLQTPSLPSQPPAVAECAAEVIEAELISEPTTALATIPEKPFLLRRSTKRELQPFQQQWFEEFWMVYPRRDDRKEAKETFARLVINQEIFDKTMEALNTELPEMLGNVKRYRKMASTWLNTEPWDNPREASPPVRALAASGGQRFNGARLTRKEQASIEFDRRVMREYGGGR